MRRALFLLLLPVSCAETAPGYGDGPRVVAACLRGSREACAERPPREQARLDVEAIMIGIEISALREAPPQAHAR